MGGREKASLRLQFNPQILLELHGATITSDAGLLAFRELDDALDLTPIASDYLQESRTGRNVRHHLVPLLRQSIYSRLAVYDDTNDAERLSQDPAMRVVVGWQGSDRNAARTNTMSRFETETLTQEDNLKGLALMNPLQPGQLYEKAGVAGGYDALDSDQSSDQADQDGWATGTPRKEAGVSACRGAGNQGNADRDTRTDQPASAGTWLACFESTGISDSYGVVRGK